MTLDVDGFKQVQRRMWSTGDFPDIARLIESAAAHVVAAADVGPEQDVLDVATGTGNVAILCAQRGATVTGLDLTPELFDAARRRASEAGVHCAWVEHILLRPDVATGTGNVAILCAQRGATVTGLDLTPELFDAARRRASEAGVHCAWVEGDAEELPYPDDSFDRVLSTFGTMFAPRHDVAAAELVRVTRPGGTIAVAAWTPEGGNGQMFKLVGSHMPPPPPELKPATLWGTEHHMRELLEPHGVRLHFERDNVIFEADSPADWLAYNERVLGPMVMARAALEPQGKWDDLHADLLKMYEELNLDPSGFRAKGEYLVTVGRMPGA